MEQEKQEVFLKLYSLRNELEKLYAEYMEKENKDFDIEEWIEKNKDKSDSLYRQYWELVHQSFDKELINKVESKIGYGKFIDEKFLDTLYELYDEIPKVLDEYKGFTLKTCKDCWGNVSAFVYSSNRQYSEAIDLFDEQSLIHNFRAIIDTGSFDFDEL